MILYLPILVLSFFALRKMKFLKWEKERLVPFLLFTSILVASLFVWALLWDMANAAGFYASSLCYLNILIIYLFILYYKNIQTRPNPFRDLVLIGFILMLLLRMCIAGYFNWEKKKENAAPYSDQYLKNIEAVTTDRNLNPYGAFLMDYHKYNNLFAKSTYFIRLGQYLKFHPRLKLATNINILGSPLSHDEFIKKQEMGLIQISIFYQFIEDQKKNNRFADIEQSQADFIDQYHIDYLIADKNIQLSPLLRKKVQMEIADPRSGERFILLNDSH